MRLRLRFTSEEPDPHPDKLVDLDASSMWIGDKKLDAKMDGLLTLLLGAILVAGLGQR
jgi:hypothetical protein